MKEKARQNENKSKYNDYHMCKMHKKHIRKHTKLTKIQKGGCKKWQNEIKCNYSKRKTKEK